MKIIKTVDQMRVWAAGQRKAGLTIGLVPTMGYLHEGHLSLVKEAAEENDAVVMSIFINPLQFGPQEDYATYPRNFESDYALAESAGVGALFHPEPGEMYPRYPPLTVVEVRGLTETLCGPSRPGHFSGVATVVSKLFNIVEPDRAYFGQKDYQQALVVKRMVSDLNIPISIEILPTVREPDGLAMSSRNANLSPGEREEALSLFQALQICRQMYESGERNAAYILKIMEKRVLKEPSAVIDYIEICDAITLKKVDLIEGPVIVALAVRFGKTRLIDNILLGVER